MTGRSGTRWLTVGLLWAMGLAIVDAIAPSVVFVAALVTAPVITAIGGSARQVAAVGAVATALALLGGVPNDFFGTLDHLARVAVVVGGSAVAVVIAFLRQRAESSESRLRVILEGLADGVTVQTKSGELVFANAAAARIIGYPSPAALLAAQPREIMERFEMLTEEGEPFPADELPGRRALLGESGPSAIIRFRVQTTGEERWAMVRSTAILDHEREEPSLAVNIIEDVTEQRRAQESQRFLAEASKFLGASLDYDETLQNVAHLAVPDLAEWCAVDIAEETRGIRHVALTAADYVQHDVAQRLRERYPTNPNAQTGAPAVIRTGTSELYAEIPDQMLVEAAEDAEHLELMRKLEMRSVLIVPMPARTRTAGAITLVRSGNRPPFGEKDQALLEELGRRAGAAVDNARVHRDRTYIARALQESLLPPLLPDIPGVDVAARFTAAGAGNEVGGDFYDLFDTGHSGWAVVIGDVCGKGAEAAAVTALARYTLRAAAMEGIRPSAVLERLNKAMVQQRDDLRFCTTAFGRLDLAAPGARLTLSCGGHPSPLLVRSDGSVSMVGRPGSLIGVMEEPTLSDQVVALRPGDGLLFYTDGLTDAAAPERVLSPEDLLGVMKGCADLDAVGMAECVQNAALEGGSGEPRDDIAILALRIRE